MFKKFALPGIVLVFALLACSLTQELAVEDTEQTVETTQEQGETPLDPVEMNCEDLALPCSVEEADPAALERGAALHQELKSRLEGGESLEDARQWLEGQDGMRAVLTGPYSLMFVLEGGLPIGVYNAAAATGAAGTAQLPTVSQPVALRPDPRPVMDVVGNDTSRENDNRHKRALVLSPFEFEYTVPDVGADAVQILQSIPDYRGRVDYRENEAVDVSAFLGWDKYDLILYTGHGGSLNGKDLKTGKEVKVFFIMTGDEQASCGLQGTFQDIGLGDAYPVGVACFGVQVRVENVVGRAQDTYQDYLGILPKFFVTNYPAGLEKAVMIFNGCMTFVSDALPARLAGSSSVYFGWDNYVLSNFNPGVITALLGELARGVPSEEAFDEVCDGGGCVDSGGLGATLRRIGPEEDLRIREIASSLHPLTDDPLGDGDKVPVYGYPGDGQVDEIPFFIEVMGVNFDLISLYTVRFEVNGQEVQGEWKLNDPEQVERWESQGLDTYRIGDRMQLPFDFTQDMPLEMTIIVELPEGGESRSVKVEALARNPVLDLQSNFNISEDGASLDSTVSAEVPLSLVEIKEDTILFESLGQEGQLKYDAFLVDIPVDQCTVEPKTQNGDLPVQKAEFRLDEATNTGFGPPVEVILYPSDNILEWYEATCQGTTQTSPPLSLWFANFAIASEDLFTDEGLVYTSWETGEDDVYARFHRDLNQPPASGEYTFSIREP